MLSFFKKKDRRVALPGSRLSLQPTYVTTSEFAKVCNVSRFTIINWVNQKKIRSVKTLGKHRRIPLTELLAFLESLSNGAAVQERTCRHGGYCWEHAKKRKQGEKCKTCSIYGSQFHYCAVLATNLGKEKIQCKGDCTACDYWQEFCSGGMGDGRISARTRTVKTIRRNPHSASRELEKKDGSFIFNVGQRIHGIQNILMFKSSGKDA